MKAIPKSPPLSATIAAPPSKSLSARALLLAAMAEGETTIVDPLDADDTRYMVDAIRRVGYEVKGSFLDGITVCPRQSISANETELFIGNAGTAMRFLTGWLAFTPGRFILRGEARMHERPIGELVEALRMLDSEVEYLEREGYPPISLRGRKMRGGFAVDVEGDRSSQFVSSLMMAGATLPDGLAVRIASLSSRPYVDLTASILRDFGGTAREDEPGLFRIHGPLRRVEPYRVEGDWSSASYWLAAAIATGGRTTVTGVREDSAQGDRAFASILKRMGASIEHAPASTTATASAVLRGGSFDCNATPDLVPTLAAIAPLADSPVEITRIATLRHKESDRIAVVAGELRKLGVRVDEREDAMLIHPGWSDDPVVIETHGDHRIAMAFAIAGLARGGVTIADETVVGKSYPRFWRDLESVVGGG